MSFLGGFEGTLSEDEYVDFLPDKKLVPPLLLKILNKSAKDNYELCALHNIFFKVCSSEKETALQ